MKIAKYDEVSRIPAGCSPDSVEAGTLIDGEAISGEVDFRLASGSNS
jgi:hypothetical protein